VEWDICFPFVLIGFQYNNKHVTAYFTSIWSLHCLQFTDITITDFLIDNLGWSPTWCTQFLFTYNTFIKILYMFRALPCSSSGGLRHNCIYAASGIVTLCRWLSCALVNQCMQMYNKYVNKQEFCASSWRSTKVILWSTVNQSSRFLIDVTAVAIQQRN